MTARHLAMAMTLIATPLAAEDAPDCPAAVEPVVSLGFGSRYAEDSKNRSDFDEESDKAVTAALKPIDEFITELAKQTDVLNNPETEEEVALAAATCVIDSILPWAEARTFLRRRVSAALPLLMRQRVIGSRMQRAIRRSKPGFWPAHARP
jgi:poly(beta-D-mannuronate) lyase